MPVQPKRDLTTDLSFQEYQYTLYYYDQAGNLVRTIPPKGVSPISDQFLLDAVESCRDNPSASGTK